MARKKLIVKPYSKLTAAHKLFATFMKLLIMSKIERDEKIAEELQDGNKSNRRAESQDS